MPPGVPVACVGVDSARNAAVLAARILERVIDRYTRPEIGAVWTDEARMTAWRDVEVAAAEALDGPDARPTCRRSARATFTVEAVKEREQVTDHDVAAFVDVLGASAGAAGRWIHYGLTSSDVLDTALALQLRRAGRGRSCPAPARSPPRWPSARASTPGRCASAAPTACTPSRRRSGSSSPASRFEAHRNAERLERAFAQAATGAISGAVGTYATLGPDYEARVLDGLGLAARAGLHPGRPARPPRRAAAGDRARGRRAGALRDRDPPPAAHGGARGRGAVPRRPEGVERDAAQAQPDHHASGSRASRASCAATPRRRWRTSRSGTSATSRTPAPSG